MEHWILIVTLLKIVVRNPRAEMMYVMKADAARDPLQNAWEAEIGASRDGGGGVIPLLMPLPVRPLELVLHEEEPEARGHGEIVGRQLDEKDARTKERYECSANQHDGRVRGPDAHDLSSTSVRSTRWKALFQHEEQRSDKQKGQRISSEAVAESPPSRTCQVLSHGQRRDVAVATTVEVARRRMVQRVLVPPVLERHECEHTSNSAHHAIRSPRCEEGSVRAIVHQHEGSYEQRRWANVEGVARSAEGFWTVCSGQSALVTDIAVLQCGRSHIACQPVAPTRRLCFLATNPVHLTTLIVPAPVKYLLTFRASVTRPWFSGPRVHFT